MDARDDWMNGSFFSGGYGDSPSPNAHQDDLINGERVFLADNYEDGESSNPPPSSASETDHQEEGEAAEVEEMEEPPSPDVPIRHAPHSEMAEAITHALNHGNNLLVECPPGYDRRSTVLKTVLQFYQDRRKLLGTGDTRIYVGTRNHQESCSILQEIKQELATTNLLWRIKISLIDHRSQMCVNPAVMNKPSPASVDLACRQCTQLRKEVKVEACDFYQNSMIRANPPMPFVPDHGGGPSDIGQHVNDIEDFLEHCHQTRRCPYFDTRSLAQGADLVICPAEILLSPSLRLEYDIKLENAILLFEDGFSLEQLCRLGASVDVTLNQLVRAAAFLQRALEHYQAANNGEHDGGLAIFTEFMTRFSHWPQDDTEVRPEREEILQFFQNLIPDPDALNVPQILRYLLDFQNQVAYSSRAEDAESIGMLGKFLCTLDLLLRHDTSFSVMLTTRDTPGNSDKPTTVFQITCADASLILKPVDTLTHSIIVSSSCLAPYQSYSTEFDVDFGEPVKILAEREIQGRLSVIYTGVGPNNVKFTLNYDGRKDAKVKREAGCAVVELCQVIPGGKLVLFNSADYMKMVKSDWQKMKLGEVTIMEALEGVCTRVFCELDMKTPADEARIMAEFQSAARSKLGAVLLARSRESLYENWDTRFPSVRGVIHVGIPFGPWYFDPHIVAKRKFLERKTGEEEGSEWSRYYHKEAFRKFNRSLTCCLQDVRNDFGVVVVLDTRMAAERHDFRQDTIPRWLKAPVNCPDFVSLLDKVAQKVEQFSEN